MSCPPDATGTVDPADDLLAWAGPRRRPDVPSCPAPLSRAGSVHIGPHPTRTRMIGPDTG